MRTSAYLLLVLAISSCILTKAQVKKEKPAIVKDETKEESATVKGEIKKESAATVKDETKEEQANEKKSAEATEKANAGTKKVQVFGKPSKKYLMKHLNAYWIKLMAAGKVMNDCVEKQKPCKESGNLNMKVILLTEIVQGLKNQLEDARGGENGGYMTKKRIKEREEKLAQEKREQEERERKAREAEEKRKKEEEERKKREKILKERKDKRYADMIERVNKLKTHINMIENHITNQKNKATHEESLVNIHNNCDTINNLNEKFKCKSSHAVATAKKAHYQLDVSQHEGVLKNLESLSKNFETKIGYKSSADK